MTEVGNQMRGGARRHFLGWGAPPLHAAADVLAGGGSFDFAGELVVVPGGRVGRRLVELLLERAESRGVPLRPPRVVSPGGLPEALYRPDPPHPSELEDRLAWEGALARTGRDELDRVLSGITRSGRGESRIEAAALLRRLHAETGAAGHDFRSVARILGARAADGGFSDEERWTVLSGIQERYRRLLAQVGREDRERARSRALREGRLELPERLWVVGVPDLPAVQRSFLEAAAEGGAVHVLIAAPEHMAEGFDPLGGVLPSWWADQLAEVPEPLVRVAEDPGGQADAVVGHLAASPPGTTAEDVTVGVPDASITPWLVERLAEVGVAARSGGGTPLGRTADARLLESIVRYLEDRSFERWAELLRHPTLEERVAGQGLPGRAALSVVDRYAALHLPAGWAPGDRLPAGGERSNDPLAAPVRGLRDAAEELLRPLEATHPVSGWTEPLAAFLTGLFGDRPLDRYREGDRERIALLEAAARFLGGARELPGELDRTVRGTELLRLVLDAVRGGAVPSAAGDGAVELLGWLELPLDDAPNLVVTGMNEPNVPEAVTADPFLPHGVRSALGMPDNDARWARDLFHLRTLVATRPRLLLLAGRRDAEGAPLLPSRLLLAESPEVAAGRLLRALGRRAEEGSGEGGGEDGAGMQGGSREGLGIVRLPPEPVLRAPSPPDRIPVTAFRTLLTDPWRYAVERILGLVPEDDEARELDAAGFGGIAHLVLERFGRSEAARSEDPRAIRGVLSELLDTEALDRFGTRARPAVRLQVEQLRARLDAFALRQAEWAAEGWRIRGVELSPGGDGAPFEVDGTPILLRGKVDRIDRNERTGEWVLLDYKTSEAPASPDRTHRRGRGPERVWVDLQLPLYLHLAPWLVDPEGAPVLPSAPVPPPKAGYFVLPRDPAKAGIQLATWSSRELEDALESARDAVRTLRLNHFEFDPARFRAFRGDPLSVVAGKGVLPLAEEDEDD